MKEKKIFITGLTGRLILGLAVFVALVTAGSILVGIKTYRDSIYRHYNDIGYQIAKSVELLFDDMDELEAWGELSYKYNTTGEGKEEIEEIINSEDYQEILGILLDMREGMDVNDIFVGIINLEELDVYTPESFANGTWNPICYIFDTYHMEEYRFLLGDKSPILPDYIDGARIS
ncbi:MAG: hypothetical protein J6T50_06140, partial [Lachnospiraceae bacterium]|nr:hypothetical protein [Lachnospiraceae bacterium]